MKQTIRLMVRRYTRVIDKQRQEKFSSSRLLSSLEKNVVSPHHSSTCLLPYISLPLIRGTNKRAPLPPLLQYQGQSVGTEIPLTSLSPPHIHRDSYSTDHRDEDLPAAPLLFCLFFLSMDRAPGISPARTTTRRGILAQTNTMSLLFSFLLFDSFFFSLFDRWKKPELDNSCCIYSYHHLFIFQNPHLHNAFCVSSPYTNHSSFKPSYLLPPFCQPVSQQSFKRRISLKTGTGLTRYPARTPIYTW